MIAELAMSIGLLLLGAAGGYIYSIDTVPHIIVGLVAAGGLLVAIGWAAVAGRRSREIADLKERAGRLEGLVEGQGTAIAIVRKALRVQPEQGAAPPRLPGRGGGS